VISDLVGLQFANASLLDEATAASEAMFLAYAHNEQQRKTFFIDHNVFPQSIALCHTKAYFLGITVIVADVRTFDFKTIE
jgi:glycine dehydrogenase